MNDDERPRYQYTGRHYIDDATDVEGRHHRLAAQRLLESGHPLMIAKTVLLEFEWLMRGYYGLEHAKVVAVLKHVLGLEHLILEDRPAIELAISNCEAGLDFADAIHHASYLACTSMATFDDRKFAPRAKKMGLLPAVLVPR